MSHEFGVDVYFQLMRTTRTHLHRPAKKSVARVESFIMSSQQSDSPISEDKPGAEEIERSRGETFDPSDGEQSTETTTSESGDPNRNAEGSDHSHSLLDACALLLSHE